MQGKVSAIALIILGLYILASVLFGPPASDDGRPSGELYHIGCYDTNRPLSHSHDLSLHLQQLAHHFNQTSTRSIKALKQNISASAYSWSGGNELARAF
jgi:hypothetical protein